MPNDGVSDSLAKYDPLNHDGSKPIRKIVEEALGFYDQIEDEDRFPVLYMLEEVIPGDLEHPAKYEVRVIAPMIGALHPVDLIKHAARALREAGIPRPDAAFVLIDSWTYPQEVQDLLQGEEDRDKIHAAWKLLPPSQHPQRVNVSVAQIANKDGFHSFTIQTRGDESTRKWLDENEAGSFIGGRMPEAMMELVRES